MSESNDTDKKCGCLSCIDPNELDRIIEGNRKNKLLDKSSIDSSIIVENNTGNFNIYVDNVSAKSRYIGSNKNFIWDLKPTGYVNGTTGTVFNFETDSSLSGANVIEDVEAIFQIWDDVLVDNMLGYDSNGNKNKIRVSLEWGTTSGGTIAWAYTDKYYFPRRHANSYYTGYSGYENVRRPILESGNCFAWTGVTLFGAQNYSSYLTSPSNHYGASSVHQPVYLPRTGTSVIQNRFIRVMVHEVGHIMGIAATWGPYRSYIEDKDGPPNHPYQAITGVPVTLYADGNVQKAYWSGTKAKKYYKGYFDTNSSGITVDLLGPPLEDLTDLGNGLLLNRHWEENGTRYILDENGNNLLHPPLDKELMTPYVEGSGVDMPFSLVCIGALEDAGYKYVNYFKGEAYPNRSGYNAKTPFDLLDITTFYVRSNPRGPFLDPYFAFSTTVNGPQLNTPMVNLPLQRTLTYKFIRSEPDSNTNHPFNIGTAWKTNGSSIAITSNGSGGVVTNGLGSASAASIVHGEELYFSVPSTYGLEGEELNYHCYTHSNMIKNFDLDDVPCFDASTKILCLRDDKEEQVLVSELKKGDLAVTYKHGALPVQKIGTATLLFNSDTDYRQTMYRLKKTDEMTDDLLVTGRHGILLDDWSTHVTEESRSHEPHTKIDDKVILSAGYCNLFEAETEPKIHTIYHFALEGDERRYGVYANGALMETWDNQSNDVKMIE